MLADRKAICRKVMMVKTLQTNSDCLRVIVLRCVIVIGFGVSLLLLSSVEVLDAIAIILIVATQVLLGGLIWREIRGSAPIEIAEFLGVGSAVGFSLALISSQVFREILPRSVAWLVLLLAVCGLCYFVKNVSLTDEAPVVESEVKSEPKFELSVIFCGTLIALSTSWYWLVPTALVCAGFVTWLLLRENFRSLGVKVYMLYRAMLVPLGYYTFQVLLDLTRVETIRNSNWWSLRFGVLQDPDVVFNESMINSVQKFGAGDNIFFAGYPLQYHWLSFAWEATLGSIRNLAPFAVSGIAGPAIVIFAIMALVYALARRLSANPFAPPATVAVIAMMCSGSIPLFRALNPYSFSYNFSLIFVFAILVLVSFSSVITNFYASLILFVFALTLFGSKSSFVPIIVCGFLGLFAFSRLMTPAVQNASKLLFGTVIAASVLALTFILKIFSSEDNSTFRFSLFQIMYQKANVNSELPIFAQIVSVFCVMLVLIFPIIGLFRLGEYSVLTPTQIFGLCSGLSAIIASMVLMDDLESQIYFLNGGFAILIPLAISQIYFSAQESPVIKFWIVVISVLLGFATSWLAKDSYAELSGDSTLAAISSSLSLLIPVIALFVFLVGLVLVRHLNLLSFSNRFLFSISTTLLLSASAGSYLANSGDFLQASKWANKRDIATFENLMIGSPDYRELLTWLEINSNETDLSASNRQCVDSKEDQRSCTQRLWSLTSAISGRQNLVEGFYPPNSESQNEERDRRMSIVIEFVENPSDENRDALIAYGVKWVVVDQAITNSRDWAPFATERFKNPAGSILELNP